MHDLSENVHLRSWGYRISWMGRAVRGPRAAWGRNLADLKHSKMCSSFEPGSQGPRVMKRRSSGGQECIMWGNWPSGKCWGCVGFGDLITRVEEKLQPPSLRPSRARKAKHILLQPGEFIVRTRGPWQWGPGMRMEELEPFNNRPPSLAKTNTMNSFRSWCYYSVRLIGC